MTSRETQNIFYYLQKQSHLKNKRNWKQVWFLIKHFNSLTFGDTFGPVICKVRGHKIFQIPYEENCYACKTCHRYIPTPSPQEIEELLYQNEIDKYTLSPLRRFVKRIVRYFTDDKHNFLSRGKS